MQLSTNKEIVQAYKELICPQCGRFGRCRHRLKAEVDETEKLVSLVCFKFTKEAKNNEEENNGIRNGTRH